MTTPTTSALLRSRLHRLSTPVRLMFNITSLLFCLCFLLTNDFVLQAVSMSQTPPTVSFNPIPGWSSRNNDYTFSLAWGDMNGDGALDLAVGNYDQPIKVYLNQGGVLQSTPAWSSPTNETVNSLAWGDMNGDGALDLAVGSSPSKVYLNQDGILQSTPTWSSPTNDDTHSLAWGDMNGDGALDLAVGNFGYPSKVYLNQGGVLQSTPTWSTPTSDFTQSIAWGDMNGDGTLDLAVGSSPSKVYLNQGGVLQSTPAWSSPTNETANSLAWGDMNGDGALDLAVGNYAQPSNVYLNQSGVLQSTPTWSSPTNDDTHSLAWGDVNGDGALDLAVGNYAQPSKVYLNQGGVLQPTPDWSFLTNENTNSLAWGDMNGDGALDLAVGNLKQPSKVYLNQGGILQPTPTWSSPTNETTSSLAWGDMNGDGALDLAVGSSPSKVYLNQGGVLQSTPSWSSPTNETTSSLAWGDMNGDGALDLAVGNYAQPSKVYLNQGGVLQSTPAWSSPTNETTSSLAWGDMNGDGALDLAVGNSFQPIKVYLNQGGVLQSTPTWSSSTNDDTHSLAWGDMNGDGALDLAVGNFGYPSKVYLNQGGVLQSTPTWSSPTSDFTKSIAWGDMNGDGALDLAVGNSFQPIKVYLNQGGILQPTFAWSSSTSDITQSIAWGDMNGDGSLDLAMGNSGQPIKVYLNRGGILQSTPAWSSPESDSGSIIAWGDMNGDGTLDLAIGGSPIKVYLNRMISYPPYANSPQSLALSHINDPANFHATADIHQSGSISFTYNLFYPNREPMRAVRVYYSLDGGFPADRMLWRVAKPTADTKTTNLSTSPYPTATITNTHVFIWDIFGSDFFGQSDNVVVRIEALPNLKPVHNGVPGPFQIPYVLTQSFPFRVRGSQVRVVQVGHPTLPVSGALVYRLPVNQVKEGSPYVGLNGAPYQTDGQGYLQGRGALAVGDRLIALYPITATNSYTLYQTSAAVTTNGLDAFTVTQGGVQTLSVSSANPLLLFNLTVSLEWDARNDPGYLAQLENDLRRTSQILFDLSNGQAALGDIAIYHDKGNWGSADVIITANNNQRPSAIMGGVVTTSTADVDINGTTIPDVYVPGQVRIGANWNRFGEAGGTLGEDWPRTLAHELGHYLFFLSDDYIGVTPDKKAIKIVDCIGSAMTDPYEEGYSEFLDPSQWSGECLDTTATHYLGRSDWQSIKKFYPFLKDTPSNQGPNQLPLAVTRIQTFAPPTATQTLAAPFFRLVDTNNATISVPSGRGQAYLLKRQGNADPTDDYLINLGTPVGDLVQARGAAPGDRLCVFDFSQTVLQMGCLESVGATASPVILQKVNNWQPQVQLTGINSNTVVVTVTNVTDSNLAVQLLPALGAASNEVTMARQNDRFVQSVTAADGAYYGYLRIWVPGSNPLKELIVEYNAVEAWGGRIRFWATPTDAWGGRIRFWAAPAYAWGGRIRFWAAPVMSNDGQVSIFSLDNPYANGARYTLQTVAFPPSLPTWLTPVGQAYRLLSDKTIPSSALLFSYLERDVPGGYENTIGVYYQAEGQRNWQALTSQLDTHRNAVSAQVPGPGTYLLVSTVEIAPRLAMGWNDIGYPIQSTQPISEGLASINGSYSVVRAFFPQLSQPWLTFDPNVQPPFVQTINTLKQLDYAHGYWIHATQAITLYLDVSPASSEPTSLGTNLSLNGPPAPAEFYGWVYPAGGISPTAGMRITAEIESVLCGETTVEMIDNKPAYHVLVASSLSESTPLCGAPGKSVTLRVASMPIIEVSQWDNTQTQQVDLKEENIDASRHIYLPLIGR